MAIEMELARILIRETDDTHVVELREVDGTRIFPIVIGFNEAFAIERQLMNQSPPRPQTHELLANVISELSYRLESVVITDLRDHTFFAQLRLVSQVTGETHEVDSRPSDALAMSVAFESQIFVEPHVLDEVCEDD